MLNHMQTLTGNDINTALIYDATFTDASINLGSIAVSAAFESHAVNAGIANTALFSNSACNTGMIATSAIFAGASTNKGIVGTL